MNEEKMDFYQAANKRLTLLLESSPHFASKVKKLDQTYYQLHQEIVGWYPGKDLKGWISKLEKCAEKENCLFFDSYNLDFGGSE